MLNWTYFESLLRFQRILEAEGIHDALLDQGAKDGDLIVIGDYDFEFRDKRNRWMIDLGLEFPQPRKRQQ